MFRFRLERVLRWRRRQADLEARKLHALLAGLRALDRERERIAAEMRRLAAAAAPRPGRPLDLQQAQRTTAWLESRRILLARLAERRRALERDAARQRDRWRAARQRQDVLERLRERRREEWLMAERRRDQKRMDEVAGRLTGRTVS